ncbi:MAG: bifunctional glycosyltransferase family 2/GtrA family protein [Gammaproteobacteria bacterium]
MRPIIVIPAYEPTKQLQKLVNELIRQTAQPIVIVNDGSSKQCDAIFKALKDLPNLHVLSHAINLGKGQALKTAMNYVLTTFPDAPGIVTADADGQHAVDDILMISEKLSACPEKLWLGARQFEGQIPLRSRFGNTLTRYIFRFFTGVSLYDTQTGLRGIPIAFLTDLLQTPTSGYDFELDMLILAAQEKLPIKSHPIKTIYEDNNASSHFNPIIDSFKIYFVFFRFLFVALMSGVFDFLIFSIAYFFVPHILISETLARVFSGTFNFICNKSMVFKSQDKWPGEALKYTLLCMLNLPFSYGIIFAMQRMGCPIHLSKIIAMIGLFFANFAIQKVLVFGSRVPTKRWAAEQ